MFYKMLIAFLVVVPQLSFAKLSDPTSPIETPYSQSSKVANSLYDNCVQGVIASRPEYASKAAEICRQFAKRKSPTSSQSHFAARTMEDCLTFMRQFSVPQEIHASVCSKIISQKEETQTNPIQQSELEEAQEASSVAF